MIEGITILATETNSGIWSGIKIFCFTLAFIFFTYSLFKQDEAVILWVMLCFISLVFGIYACEQEKAYKQNTFDCIISDKISFKDIYENYEVINKQGQIYTLKILENKQNTSD